jgi:hypothetical protein
MTHQELIALALAKLAESDVDTNRLKNGRVVDAVVIYFDSDIEERAVQVVLDRHSGESHGATIVDMTLTKV